MLRMTLKTILICTLGQIGFGQTTTGSRLEFEVASIRPSTAINSETGGGPLTSDPTHARWIKFSLNNLIFEAYGIAEDRIVGPSWTSSDKFDIRVAVPSGTTKDQVPLMLRNLLIERFGLKTHEDLKEVSGYELQVAEGGLKMKESIVPSTPPPAATGRFPKDAAGFLWFLLAGLNWRQVWNQDLGTPPVSCKRSRS